MSDFDAYAEWLQIPTGQRPPTHYDLLGVAACESDTERIYQAAMERMGIVRRYHLGEHAKDALRLQTEISRALDCLRDPRQKWRYDERLLGQTIDDELNATLNDALAGGAVLSDSNLQPSDIADPFGNATTPATGEGVLLNSRWRSATPDVRPPAVAFWQRGWFALSAVGLLVLFAGLTAMRALRPRSANVAYEAMPSPLPTAMANIEQNAETPPSKTTLPSSAGGVDLLSQLALPAEASAVGWVLEAGTLTAPATVTSVLPLPVDLPDEYNLALVVEPSSPSHALHVFLVVGGRPVVATIDGEQGVVSGLGQIGQRPCNQNETTRGGHVLSATGPSQLEFSVGRGSIRAACNGRTFLDWQGDAQALSLGDEWGAALPPRLALAASNGSYRVTSLRLLKKSTLPSDNAIAAGATLLTTQRASFTPVQLLMHAKPIEAPAGETWARLGNGMFTSPANRRAVLPIHYTLPDNYTLMATIGARPKAAAPLVFGLVVAGNPVTLVVDGFGGWLSGLELVDGHELDRNETVRGGRVLSANGEAGGAAPRRAFANAGFTVLLVSVVGNHIQASAAGRIFFDWEGDASRLSVPAEWQVPGDVSLWIGSAGGAYRVDRLVLIPHTRGGSPLASSPAMSPAPGVGLGSPFPPPGGLGSGGGRNPGEAPGGMAGGSIPGAPTGGEPGAVAGPGGMMSGPDGMSSGPGGVMGSGGKMSRKAGRSTKGQPPVGRPAAGRLPVPDAKELKLVESRVDKESRAIRKKKIFSRRLPIGDLITAAAKGLSEPAYAYAILLEARDLAAEIGDAHSALTAVDTLAQLFEVDIWELRLELFPRLAGPASKGPEGEYLVDTILQYLVDAKASNETGLVAKLIPQAQRAADRVPDKNLKKRVREKIAAIRAVGGGDADGFDNFDALDTGKKKPRGR